MANSIQDRSKAITAEDLIRRYKLDSLSKDRKAISTLDGSLTKVNTKLENFVVEVIKNIDDLQDQVDGNITTWFLSGVPNLQNSPAIDWTDDIEKNNHLGDLYYDKDTGYAYRFSIEDGIYEWIKLTDNDITEALAIANSAKDTADSKRRIFVETPSPPYDVGDIWLKDDSDIYRCRAKRTEGEFNEVDWIIGTKYTDDSYAQSVEAVLNQFKETVEKNYATKVLLETTEDSIRSSVEATTAKVESNTNEITSLNTKYTELKEESDKVTITVGKIDTKVEDTKKELQEEIDNVELKTLYTWIKYADDEQGNGISSSSVGKSYIGMAINKEEETASDNPSDYTWSKIKGDTGAKGQDGTNGSDGKSAYQIWLDAGNTGTEEDYLESLKGADGENGKDGSNGRGISKTIVEYQKGSNGTTAPTGNWQTTIPDVSQGEYLWSRTTTTYTDNTSSVVYSVSFQGKNGNDGENGQDGTSVTITDKSVTYQQGSSGTSVPSGSWSSQVPTLIQGQYLWTKTYVKYSDGNETTSYSVSYNAKDGQEGQVGATGNGIENITYFYATTTTQTTPSESSVTSTTMPTLSETNKYLWQKEVIKYTNGTNKTSVILIAVYGDKGEQGIQGEKGETGERGIQGETGSRGTGIWTTTTAPTTPNYTFTISKLSGMTGTPIVGDNILYSYYKYTITSVSDTTVLAGTRVSIRGATGTSSKWYNGTKITGTSTTATIFSESGISSAVVGDMYLNNDTQNTYRCTTAGNASTAQWVYVSNIKGDAGQDAAIQSTTAPSDKSQMWLNTTDNKLYVYNSTSEKWEVVNDYSEQIEGLQSSTSAYVTNDTLDSKLDAQKGNILSDINDKYISASDYNADQTKISSELDSKVDSSDVNNMVNDTVNSALEDVNETVSKVNEYFEFTDKGLTIGRSDSEMTLTAQNDRLSFQKNNEEKAYMSDNSFVLSELLQFQIGNFAFIPRSNGSLDFKKIK